MYFYLSKNHYFMGLQRQNQGGLECGNFNDYFSVNYF